MKTPRMMTALGLAGWLFGCAGHDSVTISEYTQVFEAQLEGLNSEQVAHFSEISTTTDVTRVAPAEFAHAERMDDHLARMNRIVGGMMSCVDAAGSPFDAAGFAPIVHDLRSECDVHSVLMLSAHDMESAGLEETRHQNAVTKQMDKMWRQLDAMMQSGSSSGSCSHCPSCGM